METDNKCSGRIVRKLNMMPPAFVVLNETNPLFGRYDRRFNKCVVNHVVESPSLIHNAGARRHRLYGFRWTATGHGQLLQIIF